MRKISTILYFITILLLLLTSVISSFCSLVLYSAGNYYYSFISAIICIISIFINLIVNHIYLHDIKLNKGNRNSEKYL